MSLLNAVDGAYYVRVMESSVYCWFGGRTVGVYTTCGHSVDSFCLDEGHDTVPEVHTEIGAYHAL